MEPGGLGPAKAEVDALNRTAQLPSIPKAALQNICAVNGLSRGGNKADLQRRIISREYTYLPTYLTYLSHNAHILTSRSNFPHLTSPQNLRPNPYAPEMLSLAQRVLTLIK